MTERKYEEGWAQIRNGVLLALSTYGAAKAGIILGGIAGLSAGAAKLIKGISYLSSGISGTFMVSEFFEGSQNISISLQKLNGQDAVNPLKSFLGEETYQKAMVASSLCSDLIGGAGAIKELVSIGREKAVGSLVDDVVDETGYGKPTGGSIYQNGNGNTSVLEEEILRSNNVSAFGEIAEGDPITYLEFQMRGSREGLTAKELEAITKVDEKAVLDRINYDAVLELRKSSRGKSVIYRELDSLGRTTGIEATITPDMIGTGSPASSSIKPAGFGGQSQGHARGHLLGNQLGGSGRDPRNLVTIYQNPVNHPVMSSVETNIRRAVEEGQIVNYMVTPIYEGDNLIPLGITIRAKGSGGLNIYQTILNRK